MNMIDNELISIVIHAGDIFDHVTVPESTKSKWSIVHNAQVDNHLPLRGIGPYPNGEVSWARAQAQEYYLRGYDDKQRM